MSASMTPKTPHAGHRARLKERFDRSPHEMPDYETLELLLGYVLPRKDTKPLAKALLQNFGNMRGVLDARRDELESVPGFGPGLTRFWRLLRECMARYEEAPVRCRHELSTPDAVARMARRRLAGNSREECWIALLDSCNRCIAWECLLRGGVEGVRFEAREVLEMVLRREANGFILVHNHPGGNATPSGPDMLMTRTLQRLAQEMKIRFVDHIIVSETECRSLTSNTRI